MPAPKLTIIAGDKDGDAEVERQVAIEKIRRSLDRNWDGRGLVLCFTGNDGQIYPGINGDAFKAAGMCSYLERRCFDFVDGKDE